MGKAEQGESVKLRLHSLPTIGLKQCTYIMGPEKT